MSADSSSHRGLWFALICLSAAVGAVATFAIFRELGQGAAASLGKGGVVFLGVASLGFYARSALSD